MALVDTLPMFVHKPLKLGEDIPTKLLPRPTTTELETPEVKSPDVDTKAEYLPEEYSAYAPMVSALETAGIKNPEARKAVLAQMGLESGWNPSRPDYNYGNITTGSSWTGKSVVRGDHDGAGKPIKQNFRSYDSPEEFANDYLNILKRNYPESYAQLTSDSFDIDGFITGLVGGSKKYATDPQYHVKLRNVYNSVRSKYSEPNS